MMYGKLCTEFYDADKAFAQDEELQLYKNEFTDGSHLLEPMCGSGRLLVPLLESGFIVDGFDNSAAMLASCKKRANERNFHPTFFLNAIDDFTSEKKYDGIVIPLGSFQLLYPQTEAYHALAKFKQWLNPGGKLIMDLFVPWEALYKHGEVDKSIREVKLADDETIIIENITNTDKYAQHMYSKTHYTKLKNKFLIEESEEEMDILWYYEHEMRLLLEKFEFGNIKQIKRFLNGHDHMTFIASTHD